jgi:hypothetical protein
MPSYSRRKTYKNALYFDRKNNGKGENYVFPLKPPFLRDVLVGFLLRKGLRKGGLI